MGYCQEFLVVAFIISEYMNYSGESDDMRIVGQIVFYILIMNFGELQTDGIVSLFVSF